MDIFAREIDVKPRAAARDISPEEPFSVSPARGGMSGQIRATGALELDCSLSFREDEVKSRRQVNMLSGSLPRMGNEPPVLGLRQDGQEQAPLILMRATEDPLIVLNGPLQCAQLRKPPSDSGSPLSGSGGGGGGGRSLTRKGSEAGTPRSVRSPEQQSSDGTPGRTPQQKVPSRSKLSVTLDKMAAAFMGGPDSDDDGDSGNGNGSISQLGRGDSVGTPMAAKRGVKGFYGGLIGSSPPQSGKISAACRPPRRCATVGSALGLSPVGQVPIHLAQEQRPVLSSHGTLAPGTPHTVVEDEPEDGSDREPNFRLHSLPQAGGGTPGEPNFRLHSLPQAGGGTPGARDSPHGKPGVDASVKAASPKQTCTKAAAPRRLPRRCATVASSIGTVMGHLLGSKEASPLASPRHVGAHSPEGDAPKRKGGVWPGPSSAQIRTLADGRAEAPSQWRAKGRVRRSSTVTAGMPVENNQPFEPDGRVPPIINMKPLPPRQPNQTVADGLQKILNDLGYSQCRVGDAYRQ